MSHPAVERDVAAEVATVESSPQQYSAEGAVLPGNQATVRRAGAEPDAEAVAWRPPPAAGPVAECRTGVEAAVVLMQVSQQVMDISFTLDDATGEQLRAMANTVAGRAREYIPKATLTAADGLALTDVVVGAEGIARMYAQAAAQRAAEQLEAPEIVVPDLALDAATADAMRSAFLAGDGDALASTLKAMEAASKLRGKVQEYAQRVRQAQEALRKVGRGEAWLHDLAKDVEEASKKVAEPLNKAKEIVEIVRDVAVIGGVAGTEHGTAAMSDVDRFEAGIDLVDKTVGRFGAAVPVFGPLWSNVYKPMIDNCVAHLRVIVRHRADDMLDLAEISVEFDAGRMPQLSEYTEGQHVPGGQPVLDYLVLLRRGQEPALTPKVRDFFLDNADLFNAGQELKAQQLSGGDWSVLDWDTWSRDGRKDNVAWWVRRNLESVWAMLYGHHQLGQ